MWFCRWEQTQVDAANIAVHLGGCVDQWRRVCSDAGVWRAGRYDRHEQ